MAVPTNGIDENIFFAVTLSDGAPFVIDAASTAQGLVFLHPLFQARDPAIAASILSRIAADPAVQTLASNIAAIYPLGGEPLTNPAIVMAYSNALVSASGLASGGGLTAQQSNSTTNPAIADADEAEFYIGVNRGDDGVYVKGSDVNPVDWVQPSCSRSGRP